VGLANVLEEVLKKVLKYEFSSPFGHPVSIKEAPDYYDIIVNPMDLSQISLKIKNTTYKTRYEFWDDFDLMRKNCYEYNETRFQHLLPYIDEVCAIVNTELERVEIKKQLDEYEYKIKHPKSSDDSKSKKNKDKKKLIIRWFKL